MLKVNGFYGHVRSNNLRSLAMFGGFLVALQAVAAVLLAVPLWVIDSAHAPLVPSGYALRYVPIVLVASAGLFALRFARHVATVRSNVQFAYVDRRSDPWLVNIVETTAIAAGLPAPKVGMIESAACNAFACGLDPASAVVVITRGLRDALDEREMTAVIAHEIAHIRHGDIRLMAAANVLLDMLLWLQTANVMRVSNWRRAVLAVLMPPYLVLAVLVSLVSNLAILVARISRLLIASSREFVADAEAVRLTKDPEALISALRRIDGRSAIAGLAHATESMMIDGAVTGPYASHPPLADRIAVLARLSILAVHLPPEAWPLGIGARRPPVSRLTLPALPTLLVLGPLRSGYQLVRRVNAGSKETLLGIAPVALRVLLIGFAAVVALNFAAAWQYGRVMRHWDSIQVGPVPSSSGGDKGLAGNDLCGVKGGRIDRVRSQIVDCGR